jgi:23S rRNA (uracil1939-C5)-methyltransferase
MARAANTDIVAITALAAQGDGIAELSGQKIFVPYTVAGDRVRVHRTGPDRAMPVEWLVRGSTRQTPPCPHFGPGKCGGCALQHVDDKAYATWKVATLQETLSRAGIAGYTLHDLARTRPGERRRAEFLARVADGKALIGFHVRGSRDAVDIGPCPVLTPGLENFLSRLRGFFAGWPGGSSFDVLTTEADTGIELVLTRAPVPDLALRRRIAEFAETADLVRLAMRLGPHGTAEIIVQRRPFRTRFGLIDIDLPPGAFLQASRSGEAAITGAVAAAIGKARRIADLYCGTGAIALALAGNNRQIHAIERSTEAVRALNAAARRAGLGNNVRAEARDLVRRPLIGEELNRLDTVIFDPPREGAAEQARALAVSNVPVVVAVSCNQATFARDARFLIDGGYWLDTITPVDQFLWSPHLELVGVFRR